MMTDPVGDMLTRIRNAGQARHREMTCPASKLKEAVARVLCKEGFVSEVTTAESQGKPVLVVQLRYAESGKLMIDALRRISTPGRRVYVGASEVPRVRSGLGMAVLSTSKGVMCDRDAREAGIGGEVLCEVW